MSNEEILHELQAIKKILTLSNSAFLDEYLSKVITTNARRKIWININGVNRQNELADIGEVSQPAVSGFLDMLKMAGLIEYDSQNPPRRILDHISASWLEEFG